MTTPSADTSFLFSLYGNDAHSPLARSWLESHGRPIGVSGYAAFELANALRCAVFRGMIPWDDARHSLMAYSRDIEAGMIQPQMPTSREVLEECERLSAGHTLTGGYRTFDLLLVASAVVTRAGVFLSFDQRQRALATLARLKVAPAF